MSCSAGAAATKRRVAELDRLTALDRQRQRLDEGQHPAALELAAPPQHRRDPQLRGDQRLVAEGGQIDDAEGDRAKATQHTVEVLREQARTGGELELFAGELLRARRRAHPGLPVVG